MDQIAAGIQLDDGEIHADAISYTDELDGMKWALKSTQVRTVLFVVYLSHWDTR